jgi:hypothetical protein
LRFKAVIVGWFPMNIHAGMMEAAHSPVHIRLVTRHPRSIPVRSITL